jgi:hypothetical protein
MGSGIEIERQGKKTSFHAQAAQDGLQAAKRGRQVVRVREHSKTPLRPF